MNEADAVRKFVARHVREDKDCDVPCMLLWNEWVRFHMKERKRRVFPETFGLKNFNEFIHEQLRPDLAYDNFRGPLYVGIRFQK